MPHTQPDGYLGIPPTGKGNAVLVLHAWWGLGVGSNPSLPETFLHLVSPTRALLPDKA